MNIRTIARQVECSLGAWRPELLPRLDQLDTATVRPDEDFAAEARAEVTTPKGADR